MGILLQVSLGLSLISAAHKTDDLFQEKVVWPIFLPYIADAKPLEASREELNFLATLPSVEIGAPTTWLPLRFDAGLSNETYELKVQTEPFEEKEFSKIKYHFSAPQKDTLVLEVQLAEDTTDADPTQVKFQGRLYRAFFIKMTRETKKVAGEADKTIISGRAFEYLHGDFKTKTAKHIQSDMTFSWPIGDPDMDPAVLKAVTDRIEKADKEAQTVANDPKKIEAIFNEVANSAELKASIKFLGVAGEGKVFVDEKSYAADSLYQRALVEFILATVKLGGIQFGAGEPIPASKQP